jgi:hypothetical protein
MSAISSIPLQSRPPPLPPMSGSSSTIQKGVIPFSNVSQQQAQAVLPPQVPPRPNQNSSVQTKPIQSASFDIFADLDSLSLANDKTKKQDVQQKINQFGGPMIPPRENHFN